MKAATSSQSARPTAVDDSCVSAGRFTDLGDEGSDAPVGGTASAAGVTGAGATSAAAGFPEGSAAEDRAGTRVASDSPASDSATAATARRRPGRAGVGWMVVMLSVAWLMALARSSGPLDFSSPRVRSSRRPKTGGRAGSAPGLWSRTRFARPVPITLPLPADPSQPQSGADGGGAVVVTRPGLIRPVLPARFGAFRWQGDVENRAVAAQPVGVGYRYRTDAFPGRREPRPGVRAPLRGTPGLLRPKGRPRARRPSSRPVTSRPSPGPGYCRPPSRRSAPRTGRGANGCSPAGRSPCRRGGPPARPPPPPRPPRRRPTSGSAASANGRPGHRRPSAARPATAASPAPRAGRRARVDRQRVNAIQPAEGRAEGVVRRHEQLELGPQPGVLRQRPLDLRPLPRWKLVCQIQQQDGFTRLGLLVQG